MDEKMVYHIYNETMKLQRKYANHIGDDAYLPVLDEELNRVVNESDRSQFGIDLATSLKRWFTRQINGVPTNAITEYYKDLWLFHKKYFRGERNDAYWAAVVADVDELGKKYPFLLVEKHQAREQLYAALDELEMRDETDK